MRADSPEDEGASPAERLERMKKEFLVAQQRRRESTPEAGSRPGDTDDGPVLTGPAVGGLTGIGAVGP